MKHHYTKCYIKGAGKVVNRGIPFAIEDISAVEADIVIDYKLKKDKIHKLEFGFSANLVEFRFETDVEIMSEEFSGDKYYYNLSFVDLPEIKKIEIDELLKSACIIRNKESINGCDYGDCKVS
jgi:hypothetical protein